MQKDLSEIKLAKDDVLNRNEFRKSIKEQKGFQEKEKRQIKTIWTEKRKREYSKRKK